MDWGQSSERMEKQREIRETIFRINKERAARLGQKDFCLICGDFDELLKLSSVIPVKDKWVNESICRDCFKIQFLK